MDKGIVEEKNNNSTKKVLIAIIIILLLALGGLTYYTFFVRNKIKEELKAFFYENKLEYLQEFHYGELIYDYLYCGTIKATDETKIYLTYLELIEEAIVSDSQAYSTNIDEIKKLGINISEISNGELNEYKGPVIKMIDGKIFKAKMKKIFGNDIDSIFYYSFYKPKIGNSCMGFNAIYDKTSDKIIIENNKVCPPGDSIITKVEDIEIVDDNYVVKTISGYVANESGVFNLYDNRNGKLVKENIDYDNKIGVLTENQEKLDKYEFKFKYENDNYEFLNSKNLSYTLSNDLKYKNKEEIDESINTFPYENIGIYNSYSEMIASTMLTTSWKNVESKYKIFHAIEAPFHNEILFEHLNLTDEEIKEANRSIVWKDASLNSGGYELIDIKEIDKKIRELYGDNVNLFEHSFTDGSIVYDKNLNILLKSLHGTTAITYERKTMIIETKSINNKYEITFINAMFEQYPGESNAKLYNVSSDNVDIPYSIAELSNNEELVNEILKENQDNLDTYKVTFELENNLYTFKNIEKIN